MRDVSRPNRGRRRRRPTLSAVAAVFACLATLALALVPRGAVAALAPDNDVRTGAVAITGIPFLHVQDTTEATTDADEDVARDLCLGAGAPAFEHAVWFSAEVTGGALPQLLVDTTASSYGTGIAVLQDTTGGLVPLTCRPGSYLTTPGAPPGTYYFVVFGAGTTPSTSGQLVVTVDLAPAPPEVDLTVDPTAVATKDGSLVLTGTVACTGGDVALPVSIGAQVSQRVGRLLVRSTFVTDLSIPCDGTAVPWTAVAPPDNGLFAGGRVEVMAFASICSVAQCTGDAVTTTLKATRAR